MKNYPLFLEGSKMRYKIIYENKTLTMPQHS